MRKHALTILAAVLATLPGLIIRAADLHLQPPVMAFTAGLAILGASFILLWSCDAAQTEISQALALAMVALIAVLPEYSVDMYFTWQAGKYPAGDYAHYAIANMTGANRLLIGVAWALIVTLYWFRFRRDVELEQSRRTELFFLGLATAYAFLIPLKGTLAWYDGLVFLGIYVWYLVIAARAQSESAEPEGPAEVLARLPRSRRRLAIVATFLFAGCVILANAEPFCEGLIATGKMLHINEFLLVQWLAPIASEAPEFTVALVFAWRGQAGLALGSLLSAKLNQWTLLVGMIPGAFALSHGTLEHPLPMGNGQMSELLLTAAQSLFAVVLLASLRLSMGGAILLVGLFAGQFILPLLSPVFPGLAFGLGSHQIHPVFSIVYLAVAGALFLQQPNQVFSLLTGRLYGAWEAKTPDEDSAKLLIRQ
jgi:cation:H+ antiporter